MSITKTDKPALILIDIQKAFNNPAIKSLFFTHQPERLF